MHRSFQSIITVREDAAAATAQDYTGLKVTDVPPRRREAETLAARLAGGRLAGRLPKTPTQNLLAGLATCALCGGGLIVETSPGKRGRVWELVKVGIALPALGLRQHARTFPSHGPNPRKSSPSRYS